MRRHATAVGTVPLKKVKGILQLKVLYLDHTQYSFSSRFEDGVGTNPEELLEAAHAGCFTMKLSLDLTQAGFTPGSIGDQICG